MSGGNSASLTRCNTPLMRDSSLATDAYVSAFFDTGKERQGQATER